MKITREAFKKHVNYKEWSIGKAWVSIDDVFREEGISTEFGMDWDSILKKVDGFYPKECGSWIVIFWGPLKLQFSNRDNYPLMVQIQGKPEVIKNIKDDELYEYLFEQVRIQDGVRSEPPANPVEKFLANVEEDIKGIGRDIRRKK